MKQFFKEGLARINSQTPIWFKKLGRIGIGMTATGLGLFSPIALGATMPPIILEIAKDMLIVGAVMKAVSAFACTTPPEQK